MYFRALPFLLILVFGCAASITLAQSADNTSPLFPKQNTREEPSNVREMLEKMRIDKEKKDHEEMLKRGQDALELSEELQKEVESANGLDRKELEKLDSLEKMVKKIRSELGGGDDSEADDKDELDQRPTSMASGFKSLKNAAQNLVDELKKTTRFSISAAAIRSTNAVLRMARWLRTGK